MSVSQARPPRQSLHEYGRGLAGGLIFSLPLLFTQEVWLSSVLGHPARLLGFVCVAFALLLLYNRFAGLREDASWLECAIDSVEELGLGLCLAAFVVWGAGQFNGISLEEMVHLAIVEGLIVAIGVSVGTAQLGGERSKTDLQPDEKLENCQEPKKDETGMDGEQGAGFLSQLAIGLCGAALFVSSIAPTEEILVIATAATPVQLFAMSLSSLVFGGYILHFSQFRGTQTEAAEIGWRILTREAIASYAVALLAAAALLYFFGRFDNQDWKTNLAQILVAGVSASLGASAGRLLLQENK